MSAAFPANGGLDTTMHSPVWSGGGGIGFSTVRKERHRRTWGEGAHRVSHDMEGKVPHELGGVGEEGSHSTVILEGKLKNETIL